MVERLESGREDFRTGINTATYRRYVDFAAENKIPYLVVDEGWSDPTAV